MDIRIKNGHLTELLFDIEVVISGDVEDADDYKVIFHPHNLYTATEIKEHLDVLEPLLLGALSMDAPPTIEQVERVEDFIRHRLAIVSKNRAKRAAETPQSKEEKERILQAIGVNKDGEIVGSVKLGA